MFNNESIVRSIARRVFPGMGKFSDGVAKLGQWDVDLVVGDEAAWLTVRLGPDMLFQLETQNGYVGARYALPTVVTQADGERRYATMWANYRRWRVGGWSDVSSVAAGIQKFFDNDKEFCQEEEKVYEILGES